MSSTVARSLIDRALLEQLASADPTALRGIEVGVATSSFQTEGALDLPGHPQSNWARWQALSKVEPIGDACGVWRDFDQVTRALRALEARVFRLSFEWARLWPERDQLDQRAAVAYARRLAALRRIGVEPLVTLQHFTHPAWLGEDLWLDERSPELFAAYVTDAVSAVQSALAALGERPVTRWITINECNMLALASYGAGVFPHRARSLMEGSAAGAARTLLALDHLATAHVRAYDAIHRVHEQRGYARAEVTHNVNLLDLYTFSQQWLDAMRTHAATSAERDRVIARRRSHFERAMLEPLDSAHSPRCDVARAMDRALAAPLSLSAFERFSRALSARGRKPAIDVRAFDLYDPWTRHQAKGAESALDALARGELGAALAALGESQFVLAEPWEWVAEPITMQRALAAVHDPDDPVALDVMENGMATHRPVGARSIARADGVERDAFIDGYALAFAHARAVLSLPARTYAHWTLVDNYELGRWAPRFGVHSLSDSPTRAWGARDAQDRDAASALRAFARACASDAGASEWIAHLQRDRRD